jgi:hypothetical protein
MGWGGILDHAWGSDGVLISTYDNDAGTLADSFRDGGHHHWVVRLRRAMGKGEELNFNVRRMGMAIYTKDKGWIETTIDHPVGSLRRKVVFPKERPCREAILRYEGKTVVLPVAQRPDGRSVIGFHLLQAQVDTPYTIYWAW